MCDRWSVVGEMMILAGDGTMISVEGGMRISGIAGIRKKRGRVIMSCFHSAMYFS